MGCCLSKHSVENQVDYIAIGHNQYGLRKITEVSYETDRESDTDVLHI
jgi:hypothetical protein